LCRTGREVEDSEKRKMFAAGLSCRFRAPHKSKSQCSKLVVDGEVVGDPESLLGAWAGHFSELSKSRVDAMPGLEVLQRQVNMLVSRSYQNEEMLLDTPFSAEEVSVAIAKLKSRKAAGPDGLMAEH